jgi:hypothetical protein
LPRRRKILDVSSAASSLPTRQPLVARPHGVVRMALLDVSLYGVNNASVSDAPIRYPFSIPVLETMI